MGILVEFPSEYQLPGIAWLGASGGSMCTSSVDAVAVQGVEQQHTSTGPKSWELPPSGRLRRGPEPKHELSGAPKFVNARPKTRDG